jgi:hypothetical protein
LSEELFYSFHVIIVISHEELTDPRSIVNPRRTRRCQMLECNLNAAVGMFD